MPQILVSFKSSLQNNVRCKKHIKYTGKKNMYMKKKYTKY